MFLKEKCKTGFQRFPQFSPKFYCPCLPGPKISPMVCQFITFSMIDIHAKNYSYNRTQVSKMLEPVTIKNNHFFIILGKALRF